MAVPASDNRFVVSLGQFYDIVVFILTPHPVQFESINVFAVTAQAFGYLSGIRGVNAVLRQQGMVEDDQAPELR